MRRQRILKELGLAPRWVLRERPCRSAEPVEPAVRHTTTGDTAEAQPLRAGAEGTPGAGPGVESMGWEALEQAVANCTACPLHAARNRTVFGVGDRSAPWLLVGEGPGAEEDARGEPFVGQAGRLLDNMLSALGLRRGDGVYIANVVKCRPPGNRTPEPAEVAACAPYLRRQMNLIAPRLVLALGSTAAGALLGSQAALGSLRGQVHPGGAAEVVVTYHPAYLLRTPQEKAKAWEDLCLAQERMGVLKSQDAGTTVPLRTD